MAGPCRAREDNSGERRNEPVRVGFALQRSDPSARCVLPWQRPERSARIAWRLSDQNDRRWKIAKRAAESCDRPAEQGIGAGVAKAIRFVHQSDGPHFAIASSDQ